MGRSLMANFLGIIADTHGLLRPEAIAALQGADIIIHAGDVGKPEILVTLQTIAPVYAVRGNVDKGAWADALPITEVVSYGDHLLYVLHDLNDLDLTPAAAGFHAVISGHSHQPRIEEHNGVLFINPGAAGPRRFQLPITLARLTVVAGRVAAEMIDLTKVG
jgi:putative phosphoesterase